MATKAFNKLIDQLWDIIMLVPPGCPGGGVLRWRGPGVVFGLDSVVELGHRPQGFYCASEATCSVLFPSGRP